MAGLKILDGTICSECKLRDATIIWGDIMSANHGMAEHICEICSLQRQIAHAEEVAAGLAEKRTRLAELLN